ncbi:MAG: class I SAM-dependent methyltransferase [Planctomycetes bacterium]|nr:class I SAM-dependent methyltransferase [Planctomycetota bacterium]MCB9872506.1 class I SAM-dependent methyltransferase [Planctomycetota bacterium]
MTRIDDEQRLNRKEAEFWDRQEEAIQQLYDRPHDWRFIPALANRIVRGRENYTRRLIAKHRGEIGRVLDIGCGSGWCVHACAEIGIVGVGVDVSGKKIETAQRQAVERGLADKCTFAVADIMELDIEAYGGKVDLLFATSSLHHLPGLGQKLPLLVERLLRPGGYMLFCEPHFEGMAPGLQKFIWGLANGRLTRNLFDHEFFAEVTRESQSAAEEGDADYNLRSESPAGLEFFGEEPVMAEILRKLPGCKLLEERYYHAFAGHLTNAFYVFMKSKVVRGLFRCSFPLLVFADDFMCRFRWVNRHAQEGVWFLRYDGKG